MAGLSYKDVALLNSSLDNLGSTFMQNRLLDEKMKERMAQQQIQQGQIDARTDFENRSLEEQIRHNKEIEGKDSGRVDVWLQEGEGPTAGTWNFQGPKANLDKIMSEAQAQGKPLKTLPGNPQSKPRMGAMTIDAADGTKYTFNINTPEEMDQVKAFADKIPKADPNIGASGAAAVATSREIIKLNEAADRAESTNPKLAAQFRKMAKYLEDDLSRANPEDLVEETTVLERDEMGNAKKTQRRKIRMDSGKPKLNTDTTSTGSTTNRFRIIGTK